MLETEVRIPHTALIHWFRSYPSLASAKRDWFVTNMIHHTPAHSHSPAPTHSPPTAQREKKQYSGKKQYSLNINVSALLTHHTNYEHDEFDVQTASTFYAGFRKKFHKLIQQKISRWTYLTFFWISGYYSLSVPEKLCRLTNIVVYKIMTTFTKEPITWLVFIHSSSGLI